MSDVQLVQTVDKEGFVVPAPYKTEALLGSIVWGVVVEGVNDMEGACEAEGVIDELTPGSVVVLNGS
jgi:hypothetical protein